MAKPSNKKVTRAARTSGGRTARGARPWGWYTAILLVIALGTYGIIKSRNERIDAASGPQTKPTLDDHWHVAYGIYICDNFIGPIQSDRDPLGIHTHNDGVVHTHPFSARAAGRNARLGLFFDIIEGLEISSDKVDLPDQEVRRNGMECDGKPAVVRTKIWQSRDPGEEGEVYNGDPADIRLRDHQLITIAFLPADAEIRKPPSEPVLDNLSDVGTTTTAPQESTSTTEPTAATSTTETTGTPPTTVETTSTTTP